MSDDKELTPKQEEINLTMQELATKGVGSLFGKAVPDE